MKKKLLTIFAVLVLVVALTASVVACTKDPNPGPKPPTPTPDVVDLGELASESANAMVSGLTTLLKTALDESKEKSYDATIALKAKVGDSVDVDLKLRVAATFGTKNSGLVDVQVKGEDGEHKSYVTVYAANNIVYVGEALTQESMKWFKVDATKDGILDDFFPQLLDMFAEREDSTKKNLYDELNETLSTYLGLLPVIGSMLFVQDQADGIVKETLADDSVKYTNNVTFAAIQKILPLLETFDLDIDKLLSGLGDGIRGIVDTVCTMIFGGDLNALLGKDGASIPEGAAADIQLNHTSKNGQLTGLELKYANDIAFDDTKPDDKTSVAVELAFENVNVTTTSTTIAAPAGVSEAKDPAIKLTIAAEVPGKDVGATVDAYVVPKVGLAAHEYYTAPTKYAKTYYTDSKTTTKKLVDDNHKCGDKCEHSVGDAVAMESTHKCYAAKGLCVHSDYQGALVETDHKHLNTKCKHYYEIDEADWSQVQVFAVATDKNGNAMNLGCAADVSGMADGTVVLKIELAGMYDLLGIENTENLPTQYQKTFQLWNDDEEADPENPEVDPEDPETDPEDPETPEGDQNQDTKPEPTNLIDKVVAIFGDGFEIGKVMGLLGDGIDFLKEIYNVALKEPNLKTDKDTNTATLDVAAILKALVANTTIKGSDSLKINGEKHLTEYLTSLQGVANLVDNIMRHTDPNKKGLEAGKAYTKEDLVKLVKTYAGIDITDAAFNNTSLVLTGIRGDATKDEGLGFTAELKSEGKTVIKLTMKVDIVDAATVPAQTVIKDTFAGEELEKVYVQDTNEDGSPKVDEEGKPVYVQETDENGEPVFDDKNNPVYKKVDGKGLNDINALMKEIHKAYKGEEEAAA